MTDDLGAFLSDPGALDVEASLPEDDDGATRGSCGDCGAAWVGDEICHCPACCMSFTTLGGFGAHRIGSFTPPRRRCRSATEMLARGYEPNTNGHWRKPMPDDKRAALYGAS